MSARARRLATATLAVMLCSASSALAHGVWPGDAGSLAGPPYTGFPQRGRQAAVSMRGCRVMFIGVPTTAAHARRYVPPEYALADLTSLSGAAVSRIEGVVDGDADAIDESALLGVWDLACDRAAGGDRALRTLRLSLVGVSVSPRATDVLADPWKQVGSANVASFYLFRIHTDQLAIARVLREAHLPVELTRSFSFTSTKGMDIASVRAPSTGYTAAANARFDDVVFGPHDHDNQFWFGSGRRAVDLRMRLHGARDMDCTFRGTDLGCAGTIVPAPLGAMAAFLGTASHRSLGFSLRHHPVPAGDLTIEPSR